MIDVSDLIGIKYKEHGRDLSGFDCYGYVMYAYKRLGIELPDFDYKTYSGKFITECLDAVLKGGHLKKINTLTDDALILFNDSHGFKSHIGIYAGRNMFSHCDKKGVHLEPIDKDKIGGIYVWLK